MVRQRADIARTDRRLILALGASVALHGGLLLANRSISATPATGAPLTLVAHLAPAPQHVPLPTTESTVTETPPKATHTNPHRTETTPSPLPVATTTTALAPTATPSPSPASPDTVASPPPVSEPIYYPVESLDSMPRLLTKMQQIYPPRARSAEIEGSVTLEILINERGEIEHASIAKAQPRGYFEEVALAMLHGQRYSPPMKNGRAVRGRYLFTVRYKLDD